MPSVKVTAQPGDTLCSLAQAAGFLDCSPLRALGENSQFLNRPLRENDEVTIPELKLKEVSKPGEAQHVFKIKNVPQPTVRFVHGSPDKPYRLDDELAVLNVSKYITDKGGAADGSLPFPADSVRQFNQAGHDDIDSFKIEVFEPRTGKSEITAFIEALRPTYDAAGVLTGHTEFPGSVDDPSSERGKRSLKCKLLKQGQSNTMRYRTPYLRLVADEADKDGTVPPPAPNGFPPPTVNQPRPTQTLLVTDMVDQGDEKVEILDQLVRATYRLDGCPAPEQQRCSVTATVPIGTDRQRIRVAVNVLRQTVNGAPVVQLAHARRRVLKWVRRNFAQIGIAPKIVSAREVNPLENMVVVSDGPTGGPPNAGGRRATGDGTLGFTINSTASPAQVIGPITPPPGQDPATTGAALAALVKPPYTATASPNPRRPTDTLGSCDIIISDTAGGVVSLSAKVSNDSAQKLDFVSVSPLPAAVQSWDGNNFLVGSSQQRVILKNHDTGVDRVDIFVVVAMTAGNRGEAMMDGHSLNPDATTHARADTKFSLFCIQSAMDGSDNDPLVLAHEMGHVAAEVLHAKDANAAAAPANDSAAHQLMHRQVTANNAVGGSKRIRNGDVVYDNSNASGFNLHNRIRAEGQTLLESF